MILINLRAKWSKNQFLKDYLDITYGVDNGLILALKCQKKHNENSYNICKDVVPKSLFS